MTHLLAAARQAQPYTTADEVAHTAFSDLVHQIALARQAPVPPMERSYIWCGKTLTLTIEARNYGGAVMVVVSGDSVFDHAIGMLAMRVSRHLQLASRIERCEMIVDVPGSYEVHDLDPERDQVALAR